jgi:hypothetical protein
LYEFLDNIFFENFIFESQFKTKISLFDSESKLNKYGVLSDMTRLRKAAILVVVVNPRILSEAVLSVSS